jgi:thiamine biosynthesis lipoprotein
MKRIAIVALCLLFILVSGCSHQPGFTEEMILMGSAARITVIPDSLENREAVRQVFVMLNEQDRRFSFFSAESELSQVNKAAASFPQKASRELMELIEKSLEYSRLTNGVFDVTATSLQRYGGYGSIIVHKLESTVYFQDPGTRIDLGGITVGYCLDKAAAYLSSQGIDNFLIDIGGDIIARGRNAGNKFWQVGLEDPFFSGRILRSFLLENEAVTTSGNYVKKHIIDPASGKVSKNRVMSVAVFAKTGIDADVLATTLFICGPGERANEIMRNFRGTKAIFVLERKGATEQIKINF